MNVKDLGKASLNPDKYFKALNTSCSYLKKALFSRKPLMCCVGGWIGHRNLGDEALYAAIKKIFYQFEFVNFQAGKAHKLLFNNFPVTVDGVLAGGTLINRSQLYYELAKEYYDIRKSLFVFGTGVANPEFWGKRGDWVDYMPQWRSLLEKCHYVGVRGPISAQLLEDAGIKNVDIIGDPVLAFSEENVSETYYPKTIGLNIGQAFGSNLGTDESIISEYVKLANMARSAGWCVKWFVVWPEDMDITNKAATISRTEEEIYEIYEDPNQFIDLVRPLSTFVGMKLHATILATCAYVPSVMLEYRPKCLDYMKSVGHEEYNIGPDRFNANNIWETVQSLADRRKEASFSLYRSIRVLRDKQKRKAEELKSNIV